SPPPAGRPHSRAPGRSSSARSAPLRGCLLPPCLSLLAWPVVDHAGCASAGGVLKGRIALVIEGADPLDTIRMHVRAPARLHHDRDRLLDRLSLAHANGALDRLDRGR